MSVINKIEFSSLNLSSDWIAQFDAEDQYIAKKIIDSIYWVTENDYAAFVTRQISNLSGKEKVAVYCERAPRKYRKKVLPFYKQKKLRPRTFEGVAQFPIPDHAKHRVEVGSEGVTATIINNLKRKNSNIFFHPTAEYLKKHKIKRYIIVTDLIASGDRIRDLLDSFWAVHSIKALNSARLIEFHVISYACSRMGFHTSKYHPLRPNIHHEIICPDEDAIFQSDERPVLLAFLQKYTKAAESDAWGFSYGDTPLYIVFEHCAPNNLPSILFKGGKRGIKPLFRGRSTSDFYEYANQNESNLKSPVLENLEHDSYFYWILKQPRKHQQVFVILTEINKSKSFRQLMEKTLMKRSDLEEALRLCVYNGWISQSPLYITDRGRKLRDQLGKKTKNNLPAIEPDPNALYYCPESLRAP